MNTISNSSSDLEIYLEKKIQAAKDLQEYIEDKQNKQKTEETDSVTISDQGIQALNVNNQIDNNNSVVSSLESSGVLTEDQANAVQSIFESTGKSIQSSGIYSNVIKSKNPLSELVSSGTITQDQADTIKEALQSAAQNSTQS